MSKAIVYHKDGAVTGVERVEPVMLEAFRIGLFGDDAVAYKRAVQALGAETIATLTKTAPKADEDETLAAHAQKSGKAFVIVAETDLPPERDGRDGWRVEAGAVTAGA